MGAKLGICSREDVSEVDNIDEGIQENLPERKLYDLKEVRESSPILAEQDGNDGPELLNDALEQASQSSKKDEEGSTVKISSSSRPSSTSGRSKSAASQRSSLSTKSQPDSRSIPGVVNAEIEEEETDQKEDTENKLNEDAIFHKEEKMEENTIQMEIDKKKVNVPEEKNKMDEKHQEQKEDSKKKLSPFHEPLPDLKTWTEVSNNSSPTDKSIQSINEKAQKEKVVVNNTENAQVFEGNNFVSDSPTKGHDLQYPIDSNQQCPNPPKSSPISTEILEIIGTQEKLKNASDESPKETQSPPDLNRESVPVTISDLLSDTDSVEDVPCSLAASSSGLVLPRPITSKKKKKKNSQSETEPSSRNSSDSGGGSSGLSESFEEDTSTQKGVEPTDETSKDEIKSEELNSNLKESTGYQNEQKSAFEKNKNQSECPQKQLEMISEADSLLSSREHIGNINSKLDLEGKNLNENVMSNGQRGSHVSQQQKDEPILDHELSKIHEEYIHNQEAKTKVQFDQNIHQIDNDTYEAKNHSTNGECENVQLPLNNQEQKEFQLNVKEESEKLDQSPNPVSHITSEGKITESSSVNSGDDGTPSPELKGLFLEKDLLSQQNPKTSGNNSELLEQNSQLIKDDNDGKDKNFTKMNIKKRNKGNNDSGASDDSKCASESQKETLAQGSSKEYVDDTIKTMTNDDQIEKVDDPIAKIHIKPVKENNPNSDHVSKDEKSPAIQEETENSSEGGQEQVNHLSNSEKEAIIESVIAKNVVEKNVSAQVESIKPKDDDAKSLNKNENVSNYGRESAGNSPLNVQKETSADNHSENSQQMNASPQKQTENSDEPVPEVKSDSVGTGDQLKSKEEPSNELREGKNPTELPLSSIPVESKLNHPIDVYQSLAFKQEVKVVRYENHGSKLENNENTDSEVVKTLVGGNSLQEKNEQDNVESDVLPESKSSETSSTPAKVVSDEQGVRKPQKRSEKNKGKRKEPPGIPELHKQSSSASVIRRMTNSPHSGKGSPLLKGSRASTPLASTADINGREIKVIGHYSAKDTVEQDDADRESMKAVIATY